MPDVFLPLSVLAIYLVAFTSWKLRTCEIVALLATIAFAIAAHIGHFCGHPVALRILCRSSSRSATYIVATPSIEPSGCRYYRRHGACAGLQLYDHRNRYLYPGR